MNAMLRVLPSFFAYSIIAIGAQNAIFTRGLGLSQGLRMINDPKKDTMLFCTSLMVFQLLNSILAYFVLPLISKTSLKDYVRFATPVVIVICCALTFVLVVLFLSVMVKKSTFKRVIFSLTSASINSAIVGTIILSSSQGFTFLETIGFALGSSIGYLLAMLLVDEGERKIRHDLVPASFQGLPVTLIYIAVLALAAYGLTGHSIAL